MFTIPRLSGAACVAVAAFGLLSLLGGCIVVYFGGFHTQQGRHGGEVIFVSGLPGIVMAWLQLMGAWIALSAWFAQKLPPNRAYLLAAAVVVLAPVLVLVAQRAGW